MMFKEREDRTVRQVNAIPNIFVLSLKTAALVPFFKTQAQGSSP